MRVISNRKTREKKRERRARLYLIIRAPGPSRGEAKSMVGEMRGKKEEIEIEEKTNSFAVIHEDHEMRY